MENVSVRAIMIGVGVLIAVATISAVMMYYNSAKEAVRRIGPGNDIVGEYDKRIGNILLKKNITGIDVKNILNYFYGRNDAEIILDKITIYNNEMENEEPLFNKKSYNSKSSTIEDFEKINQFILPNGKYKITDIDKDNGLIKVIIKDDV